LPGETWLGSQNEGPSGVFDGPERPLCGPYSLRSNLTPPPEPPAPLPHLPVQCPKHSCIAISPVDSKLQEAGPGL
jgi:hypothetical protein